MSVALRARDEMKHLLPFLSSLLVLSGLLALAPEVARAQPADPDPSEIETEARARFQLGQLYYSQARFAEAAAEFEAAYAAHPHPLLLHNLYLARRDLGDTAGAIEALTHYLAVATDLSAADRRLLEGRLQTMQRQIESTTPTPDPRPDPDPEPGDPESGPAHEDGTPDGSVDLAPPVGPTGGLGMVPGGLVLGIGGAVLIGAAIAAGVAEGVRSERDGMCTLADGACPASLDQASYASRFASARDAAWALFISGAVTATVGAVLLGVGASGPSSDAPAVSAACDANGCSAVVSGVF